MNVQIKRKSLHTHAQLEKCKWRILWQNSFMNFVWSLNFKVSLQTEMGPILEMLVPNTFDEFNKHTGCKNSIAACALANNLCAIEHFQTATIPTWNDTNTNTKRTEKCEEKDTRNGIKMLGICLNNKDASNANGKVENFIDHCVRFLDTAASCAHWFLRCSFILIAAFVKQS